MPLPRWTCGSRRFPMGRGSSAGLLRLNQETSAVPLLSPAVSTGLPWSARAAPRGFLLRLVRLYGNLVSPSRKRPPAEHRMVISPRLSAFRRLTEWERWAKARMLATSLSCSSTLRRVPRCWRECWRNQVEYLCRVLARITMTTVPEVDSHASYLFLDRDRD